MRPLKVLLVSGLVTLGVLASASYSLSQGANCGSYQKLIENLEGKFKEHRRWVGLTSSSPLVLYTSNKGESFTIFTVLPNGVACVVASGKTNSFQEPPVEGENL